MTPPDPQLYAGLDKDVPIVFLPVRLETRWGPLEEDSNGVEFRALRIRIYPDDIAIDTHDPTLTDAEIAAGRAFWDAHDEPTAGEPERLEAWSALARAVEAQRALHVARATRDRTVEPPRRSGARAEAIARLLPDRWVVTGWVAGGGRYVVEQSEPVRRPLTVGPAQRDDGGAVLDPEDPLLLDPGSRWLADFYEARAAGMALIVNVPAPGGVARLDALYVFGVRVPSADGDPSTEAAELADVLRRQGASVGAGFLPAGTPTNNLNGSRSGWSSVPDLQELYRRLQAPAPAPRDRALEGDGTAGEIAVAALGVPSTAVEGFAREGDASARHARAMAQALFPVTWGELIGTLLVPSRVDAERDRPLLDALADVLSFAEEHAVDYVRGRGPLPTLRVGRQPYGILPVTDFTRWRRQDGEPPLLAGLAAQLGRLRPFWDEAASRVPQFPKDRSGRLDEAGRTLAGLLALGPVPHPAGYWITPATGELTTKIYNTQRPLIPGLAADGDLSDEELTEIALGTRVVVDRHMLSYLWPRGERSRLLRMKPGKPEPLRFPVAQPAKVGDEVLSPSEYLQRLARDSVPDILRVATVDPPRDLLYQLIYRSLVLASEQSALALIRGWLPPEHPWASTILATSPDVAALGLDDGPTPELAMTTPFAKLAEMAQADAPASAIRTLKAAEVATKSELLREARDTIGERLRPLAEQFVRTQAAVLALGAAGGAGLDSAELTRLLGETLATCGTRLDAWLTSIATRRLALLRRARPEGVYVGAYGWLLDLAPDEIPVPEPPDGWAEEGLERFETVMPAEPVGYVHAPSLAQATTAALLRAAELVHGEGGSSLARLDLTSRRVRTAAWILDAVHNGQPLPAVLGYRLERALHDRSDAAVGVNLHRLVDPLRRAYPQRDAPAPDGAPPRDRHVPPEVVDGLAVWEAWRADPGVAERLLRASLPAGVAQPSHATTSALAEVMRELDGAVEAVADLVVAEGVHQLAAGNPVKAGATFDAVAAATPPPADLEVLRTPRTGTTITHRLVLAFDGSDDVPPGWDAARPRAQASSHAEAWAARVLGSPSSWSFVDGHGQPCTLADFGALCALDVVAEATGTATSQPLLARRAPGGAVSGDAWDRLLAVARTLADVLSSARPLVPADLATPPQVVDPRAGSASPPPGPAAGAVDSLETLVRGADGLLERARDAARRLAQGDDDEALATLAAFGLPAAVAGDRAAAAPAAQRLVAEVDACVAGYANLTDSAPRLDVLTRATRILLGGPVVLTPALDAAPDVTAGFDPPGAPPPDGLDDWLARLARVRPAIAAFDDLRLFADALGAPSPELKVAQLPLARDEDTWLGGQLPADTSKNALRSHRRPRGPHVHLVIAHPAGADPAAPAAGVVVDELTEVLPAGTETTGVAVHYDAPNARAPQSLLLAVHPDPFNPGVPWSWEMIEAMLEDTLELARFRAVDLDQLDHVGLVEFLPAAYAREGIGTNFKRLIDLHVQEVGLWSHELFAAHRTAGE